MEEMKYFLISNDNYWSRGDSLVAAMMQMKGQTSRKPSRKFALVITDDIDAYVNQIDGGVCTAKGSFYHRVCYMDYLYKPVENKG